MPSADILQMEREVRERYETLEALLRGGIERGNQMHA